jgi:hypothetical protein
LREVEVSLFVEKALSIFERAQVTVMSRLWKAISTLSVSDEMSQYRGWAGWLGFDA